jgi:hypothetical protein
LNVADQLLDRGAALGDLIPAHARVEVFTIATGPIEGTAWRASFAEVISNWKRAGFAVPAVSNECIKHLKSLCKNVKISQRGHSKGAGHDKNCEKIKASGGAFFGAFGGWAVGLLVFVVFHLVPSL